MKMKEIEEYKSETPLGPKRKLFPRSIMRSDMYYLRHWACY